MDSHTSRRALLDLCVRPPHRSGLDSSQILLGGIKMATCPQTGALLPAGEHQNNRKRSAAVPGLDVLDALSLHPLANRRVARTQHEHRLETCPPQRDCDTRPPIVSFESKDTKWVVRGFIAQSLVDLHEVCVLQLSADGCSWL